MKRDLHVSSLLPYLQTNQKIFLKIPPVTGDPSFLEKTSFPFIVVIDSDPLARLVEAQFLTDGGSELKKVFLLVQRDRYLLTSDGLWPLNNLEVDQAWQQVFSFHAREKAGPLTILSQQVDDMGRLRPLQSLFFCKRKQIFFYPPCPKCGLPLHLCYDNDLLRQAGLQPYSSSLKRYLFCPSCTPECVSEFYVYELDNFDPPILKDRVDLIRGFGQLLEKQCPGEPLPCLGCSELRGCYGPDNLVFSRIVPFSFYPFFLFIFGAGSLPAADYLPLISGATFEEVESQLQARGEMGRVRCLKAVRQGSLKKPPSLSGSGEMYFGEVLYLKLSFLDELLRSIFPQKGFFNHPDLWLAMDRIWVNLPNQGGLLPFLWNFKIEFIDLSRNLQETRTGLPLPVSAGLYFLGRLWFYTLLVNKRQSISEVYRSLGEAVDQSLSGGDSPLLDSKKGAATFFPENIFWDPEGKVVNESWIPLWDKALSLGLYLIKASLKMDPQWSEELFLKQLEELREEGKENLFGNGTVPEDQAYLLEKEAILRILTKIQDKWQAQVETVKKQFVEDTLLISPEVLEKEAPAQEELAETILISSGVLKKEDTPQEEVAETIMLSAEKPKKGVPSVEELGETIILPQEKPKSEILPPHVQETRAVNDIPETVIISPSISAPGTPSPTLRYQPKDLHVPGKKVPAQEVKKPETKKEYLEDLGGEGDFSSETVILGPQKISKKDNDGSKR